MTVLPPTLRARYDLWRHETYPRLAPLILMFCLVVSTAAAVGVLWLTKVQGDEQDRRASAINGLLGCFDSYASQSAATSKAVRTASERVSTVSATEARANVAWTTLLAQALTFNGDMDSPDAQRIVNDFIKATGDLNRAQADLVLASDNLAEVREQNPVPDPPRTFCTVQP